MLASIHYRLTRLLVWLNQCIAKKDARANLPAIRVLTIWFGANDACILPSPQHVPFAKFKANLERMVWMLQSPDSEWYSPETRIVLITPPPVNTHKRKADLEARDPPFALDRLFDTTKAYAEAVKDIAKEKGVGVVDAWTPIWEGAGQDEHALSKYLPDGLHLSEAGYQVSCGLFRTARFRQRNDCFEKWMLLLFLFTDDKLNL